MQTRRGFLKTLGIGVAACVVGPAILKKIPTTEVKLAGWDRAVGGTDISRYFLARKNRFNEQIMERLGADNPYYGLIDPEGQAMAKRAVAELDRAFAENYRGELVWQENRDLMGLT